MPARDLNGNEIPAGKFRRRLEYDALCDDGSPEWLTLFGDATEQSTSIARGRGELELTVDGVGGYLFPGVDPESVREVRVGVGLHDGLAEPNTVALGFRDVRRGDPANALLLEQASSRSELRSASVVRLADGTRSTTEDIGAIVGALARTGADTDVCAWVEVRIRPFERGEVVAVGGAGRGDVAHAATDQPYGVATPMYPVLSVDTTPAGSTDTVGIPKAWFEIRHN